MMLPRPCFKVLRKLVSGVRSVDIRDRENVIKIGLLFSGKKNFKLISNLGNIY